MMVDLENEQKFCLWGKTFTATKEQLTKASLTAKTYHGDDRNCCLSNDDHRNGLIFSDFSVNQRCHQLHTTWCDQVSERTNPRSSRYTLDVPQSNLLNSWESLNTHFLFRPLKMGEFWGCSQEAHFSHFAIIEILAFSNFKLKLWKVFELCLLVFKRRPKHCESNCRAQTFPKRCFQSFLHKGVGWKAYLQG